MPPGQLAASFRADVEAGRLPKVSYLVPSSVDSEHPSASSPSASAVLIYDILDALASNPDVWSRTALLINFDEFDGYFDHVPPPVPPVDQTDEYFDGKPLGLGFRVPMTVVSPWSLGGFVCSETFDHTSRLHAGARPHRTRRRCPRRSQAPARRDRCPTARRRRQGWTAVPW